MNAPTEHSPLDDAYCALADAIRETNCAIMHRRRSVRRQAYLLEQEQASSGCLLPMHSNARRNLAQALSRLTDNVADHLRAKSRLNWLTPDAKRTVRQKAAELIRLQLKELRDKRHTA